MKKEAQNGNPMLLVKVLNHPLTFKNIITNNTKGVNIIELFKAERSDKE